MNSQRVHNVAIVMAFMSGRSQRNCLPGWLGHWGYFCEIWESMDKNA